VHKEPHCSTATQNKHEPTAASRLVKFSYNSIRFETGKKTSGVVMQR